MRMIYRLVHQSSEYCGVLARIARDGSVLSAWHSSRFRQKQEPADRFQQLTSRIMKFKYKETLLTPFKVRELKEAVCLFNLEP